MSQRVKPRPTQAVASNRARRRTQFQLSNGMQVLVIPDHRAPVVTQMLWFKVGGMDDPPGLSARPISSSI